jgi:hypothetical protein
VFPEGGIFITIIRCLFFLKNKDSKKKFNLSTWYVVAVGNLLSCLCQW